MTTDTRRFDSIAATWDEEPSRVRLAAAVAESITKAVGLTPSTAVLDFGCGTGLLTLALQPHVGQVTGADTSVGMLGVLERKIHERGIASVAVQVLRPEDDYAIVGEYDLIVSSMTLHHVPDLAPLFARFRACLRPGGHVAFADLDREDGTFHKPDVTDVYHPGFERSQVREWLEQAGFDDVSDTTAFVHQRNGREYPVFLICARTR